MASCISTHETGSLQRLLWKSRPFCTQTSNRWSRCCRAAAGNASGNPVGIFQSSGTSHTHVVPRLGAETYVNGECRESRQHMYGTGERRDRGSDIHKLSNLLDHACSLEADRACYHKITPTRAISLRFISTHPTLHVGHPPEVGWGHVDHADAADGGWRRHREVHNLEQHFHLDLAIEVFFLSESWYTCD